MGEQRPIIFFVVAVFLKNVWKTDHHVIADWLVFSEILCLYRIVKHSKKNSIDV